MTALTSPLETFVTNRLQIVLLEIFGVNGSAVVWGRHVRIFGGFESVERYSQFPPRTENTCFQRLDECPRITNFHQRPPQKVACLNRQIRAKLDVSRTSTRSHAIQEEFDGSLSALFLNLWTGCDDVKFVGIPQHKT